MRPNRKIWFPAKKYGWGWGLPCCWQGWVVFIIWLAAVISGSVILAKNFVFMELFIVAMSAILIGICWWKGEKPKWRWGNQ